MVRNGVCYAQLSNVMIASHCNGGGARNVVKNGVVMLILVII